MWYSNSNKVKTDKQPNTCSKEGEGGVTMSRDFYCRLWIELVNQWLTEEPFFIASENMIN